MIKRMIEYIHGFGKRQEDIQVEMSALRNEIEELKDLVRGECAAREELEKRREATRKRVAKHRSNVTLQIEVERNEEEKRELPPIPPIESKEEAKKESLSLRRERVARDGFQEFWDAYPGFRKTKRTECYHKFNARIMESKDPEGLLRTMLEAVECWKATRLWIDDGGKFVMSPIVWLNNACWEKENIPKPMSEDGVDCVPECKPAKQEKPSKTSFTKPTLEEITEYCHKLAPNVDPNQFWHFYESNGWKVGKNRMVNWQDAVVNWQYRHETEAKRPALRQPQRPNIVLSPTEESIERAKDTF